MNFWGPMANIKTTAWIVDSAVQAAAKFSRNFFYHLPAAPRLRRAKHGPDSEPAPQGGRRTRRSDRASWSIGMTAAYGDAKPLWLVASEYVITPVDHVTYPNRLLREAGLLKVIENDGGELIDFAEQPAWALVDHQFSHVFVKDRDARRDRTR